ncbi:MFS general substrate transporter [Gymnopus androsaceus JB14]|uniref:MFS general substrate transporter n=1 Tax=Gymnopus androsaceus JB14 TaxID=1447944 RepID=A0A6A4IAF9_9AGAR|nr:MFS general substrate transporter [Gymnopus androsaceus JB14]
MSINPEAPLKLDSDNFKDIEYNEDAEIKKAVPLKLDKHGIPLTPQPSDDPEDPYVFVLLQVGVLAALGTYNTAAINPAYAELAAEFGISTITASYQTTVVIAIIGIGPFLFIPFREYLWTSSELANDLFCLHQRGRALGVYTVLFTTGGHLAPIPGGLIGQFLAAIMNSVCFLFILFFLPETLYIRDSDCKGPGSTLSSNRESAVASTKSSLQRYLTNMRFSRRYPGRELKLSDFFLPYIKMIRYPAVVFPAIYFGTQYGLGSTLPAVTVSHIFAQEFGWDTLQIGLAYGTSLLIGTFLGETAGGWVVDSLMNQARQRAGSSAPSEIRLKAVWTGEIIVPAGLLMYGFSIQFGAPWIVSMIGMAMACFGVQCITTVMYTYSTDCYPSKAAEVAQVFNFVRQEIGMTFAFYAIVLGQAIGGYHLLFVFFACVGSILAFIPILVLMWKGEAIRAAERRDHLLDM